MFQVVNVVALMDWWLPSLTAWDIAYTKFFEIEENWRKQSEKINTIILPKELLVEQAILKKDNSCFSWIT